MPDRRKEEVWDFANGLCGRLELILALIPGLGMVFSAAVVHAFTANSGSNVSWDQAISLNRVIFPYLFFVALAALASGILNCFQVFGLPAATSVFLNLAVILFSTALVWPYFKDPAVSLSVGVFVGGALQFLMPVPALVQKGINFKFGISFF